MISKESPNDATILDPPIDDEGEQECAKLSENLTRAMKVKGIPPAEVIVTSPLARALRTTQVGVATVFPSLTPLVLEGLREKLDGTAKNHRHSKEWIQQHFTAFRTEEVDLDDQLGSKHAQSVEPYEALWRRVQGAFSHIFENFREALVVALVSHCHVEQTIQREITGWDVPESEKRDKVEFYVGDSGVYAMIVKGVRTNQVADTNSQERSAFSADESQFVDQ